MGFDDETDDDRPPAPLLPPEDRLWRHPSETAARTFVAVPERAQRASVHLWAVALGAGAAGALGAAVVIQAFGHHAAVRTVAVPAVERQAVPVSLATPSAAPRPPLDVVAIVQRVGPAIVGLEGRARSRPFTGSGVLFRSDGFLLTDARLVAGATVVTAVLADHRRVGARVLGTDAESGIAVVKLDGYGYPVAALGSIAGVSAGEPAIAIGSRRDAGFNDVSVGAIRLVGRSVVDDGVRRVGLIESDTRTGPESLGGALLDANGVVIGITTRTGATSSAAGGGAATLATPVDLAYAAGNELIAEGHVVRVWLGLDGTDLDAAHAKALGVPGGVTVTAVDANSPAARIGVRPGDVITSVDGERVVSMGAFMVALRTHRPGERLVVHVRRGDEDIVLMPTLAAPPTS